MYGSIPIIFLFMFLFRFVTILLFNPLVLKGGTCERSVGRSASNCEAHHGMQSTYAEGLEACESFRSPHAVPSSTRPISGLNLGQAVFVMAGGLRGALSLILVADLIITSNFHSSAVVGKLHGLSGMVTVQA